jgi:hypothetical protein
MLRIVALFALVFTIASNAYAGPVIHVADGDCAALTNAIASAPADKQTTIILAHGGSYLSYGGAYVSCGFFVHSGDVVVEGSGSEIQAVCLSSIVRVEAGARLTIRNALLSAPDCGFTPPLMKEIDNTGELQLEAVNVSDFHIYNDVNATMTLRNVTAWGGVIDNVGSLAIFNSTLQAEPVVSDSGNASMELANSVLPTAPTEACAISGTHIQSLGGNVAGGNCTWAVSTDRRSSDDTAGLGPFQPNGGLGVPTFAPTSSSIVRGAGLAKYCEPVDARGLVRPAAACDAGAAQFDARKYVGEGGMNGVWYDRAANGHYVTIQRVHDDDTALVIWNTFDHSGNQAWIYGVGHVTGRHISIVMSQNLGGTLQPGGAPTGSSVQSWGTVDIDLANCVSGTLRYQSTLPAFGSGQFPLDRLAYVSDFGCVN